ncbi:TM2 domain-containing protein 2 [Cichlidogyrus casuarinus]|uniref:TM2 domain-containing protein 2 n=1 Tax=Cichlidogyrus casuarinus TaxID=1844966 RepID=A0ABD2Q3N2_9PLAT
MNSSLHGCHKWGGSVPELTKILCRPLPGIECSGDRNFTIPNYPCIKYSHHLFLTTLLISIFFGILGADRFVLNHTGTGVAKLLTIGGLGIWWIVDIEIAPFSIEDPGNREFQELYPNGMQFEDLLPYYDFVAERKMIELEWKCPGRVKKPNPAETKPIEKKSLEPSSLPDANKEPTVLDMDFDAEDALDPSLLSRSIMGSKTHRPREQVTVTMDSIVKGLVRKRKEERMQQHNLKVS